jgi:hypothetical protein
MAPLAVSPDGRHLALLDRNREGRTRLWVHRLDTRVTRELPGTDNALATFWSPHNRSLGFFADRRLLRIDLAVRPAVPICDTATFNSPSWGRSGVIIFAEGLNSRRQL